MTARGHRHDAEAAQLSDLAARSSSGGVAWNRPGACIDAGLQIGVWCRICNAGLWRRRRRAACHEECARCEDCHRTHMSRSAHGCQDSIPSSSNIAADPNMLALDVSTTAITDPSSPQARLRRPSRNGYDGGGSQDRRRARCPRAGTRLRCPRPRRSRTERLLMTMIATAAYRSEHRSTSCHVISSSSLWLLLLSASSYRPQLPVCRARCPLPDQLCRG